MSLYIKGLDMPEQIITQTEKGDLKLWSIRDERYKEDKLFGAAGVPCTLWFNHDGTVVFDLLGVKYSVVEVPTPHGRLIDADDYISDVDRVTYVDNYDYDSIHELVHDRVDAVETIIEAEK